MGTGLTEGEARMLLALGDYPSMRRSELATAAKLDPQEADDVMLTLFRGGYLSFNSISVHLEARGRNVVREMRREIEKLKNEEQLRRGS